MDLDLLLKSNGFNKQPNFEFNEFYTWFREDIDWLESLSISTSIFDNDNHLKYIKKSEWEDKYINFKRDIQELDDDSAF